MMSDKHGYGAQSIPPAILPAGWKKKESSRKPGVFYYYNTKTKETQWDLPTKPVEFEDEQKVRVRHILRKHKDSRRPSSWRLLHITQTKEDSCDQIQQMKQILMHTLEVDGFDEMVNKFIDLASRESDCGSYSKGGDLGLFGRGAMQKPFEDASYALAVGGLSDLIDTDSGIHLILRIE